MCLIKRMPSIIVVTIPSCTQEAHRIQTSCARTACRGFPTKILDIVQSNDTERGSDGSAANGGRSDLSEWQRSTVDDGISMPRRMSGTATGMGSDENNCTVHALSVATRHKSKNRRLPPAVHARRKEERKNEKLNLSNYIVP